MLYSSVMVGATGAFWALADARLAASIESGCEMRMVMVQLRNDREMLRVLARGKVGGGDTAAVTQERALG
jgi:hypothetical protein